MEVNKIAISSQQDQFVADKTFAIAAPLIFKN